MAVVVMFFFPPFYGLMVETMESTLLRRSVALAAGDGEPSMVVTCGLIASSF